MTRFFKPLSMLGLTALFVVAGWLGGPGNRLEINIMEWFAAMRANAPSMAKMAGALTNVGGAYVTVGLTATAALYLVLRRSPALALLLVATVLIERSAVEWLKLWVGRPRPDFGVEYLPQSLAFPSGHSANSMTAFLAIALIAMPLDLRRTATVAALSLSVLVGLTRVCLGVHWPSDVIGGWAFGLLAVGSAVAIGRRTGLLRFEPQHQIVGRHGAALGEDETA